MFVDESIEPVVLQSNWKQEKTESKAEGSSQTEELLATGEKASQSYKMKQKQVQTDDYIDEQIEISEDDSPEFLAFLRRTEPVVSRALKSNWHSRAFADYEVNWGDEHSIVTNIHTLQNAELDQQLQVTGLCWNCTGAVIAAALGRFDHEDWCTHKSMLCTWNLDRRGLNPDKPNTGIDVSSCLMCIDFHPTKPSLIVGGTFNGEVIVWDTSLDEEPIVYSSGIGDDSHRDPVAKVQWIQDPDSALKYNIMSVSSDGRMLVWKMHPKKPILNLLEGYVLLVESLPRSARGKTTHLNHEMGVTCISFNKQEFQSTGTFLIGSDSGAIFKCSTHSRGTPGRQEIPCSIPLHSPVTFGFSSHHGPVYGVESSPYHRNLFLSCGTDNSIRIYSALQSPPLHDIEAGAGYLYAAKWSPVRPMVFAVATESGKLLLYDLKSSKTTPVMVLEANERRVPLYCMQFNHARDRLLATGDGMGFIQIWQLNDVLTHSEPRELEALDEIACLATELEGSKHDIEKPGTPTMLDNVY